MSALEKLPPWMGSLANAAEHVIGYGVVPGEHKEMDIALSGIPRSERDKYEVVQVIFKRGHGLAFLFALIGLRQRFAAFWGSRARSPTP